jgi:hypothetical protein
MKKKTTDYINEHDLKMLAAQVVEAAEDLRMAKTDASFRKAVFGVRIATARLLMLSERHSRMADKYFKQQLPQCA